jgi:hypothetical protein
MILYDFVKRLRVYHTEDSHNLWLFQEKKEKIETREFWGRQPSGELVMKSEEQWNGLRWFKATESLHPNKNRVFLYMIISYPLVMTNSFLLKPWP